MQLSQILRISLSKQDIDTNTYDEIPFNVHVEGDISYFFCFLIYESEKYLIVAETTLQGTEELRIIKKEKILSIDVCYDVSMFLEKEEDVNDVMFV